MDLKSIALNEVSQRERDKQNDLYHMQDIEKHFRGLTNVQRQHQKRVQYSIGGGKDHFEGELEAGWHQAGRETDDICREK